MSKGQRELVQTLSPHRAGNNGNTAVAGGKDIKWTENLRGLGLLFLEGKKLFYREKRGTQGQWGVREKEGQTADFSANSFLFSYNTQLHANDKSPEAKRAGTDGG